MRIKGSGPGQQGQSGPSGQGRERAANFRARHSVGERIRGRVLRRDPSGLYWVQAGGEELLAQLEVHAEPGDALVFVVRALTPEIHLQALSGDAVAADLPSLVQRFRAAREAFESLASPLLNVLGHVPPVLSQRQEAFGLALSGDADAAGLHSQAQALLSQINAALAPEQGAEALYLPWLLPALRRQEMVRRAKGDKSFVEACLSGRLPDTGALELRLASRPEQCSLRILAEQPENCGALQAELAALVRHGLGVELLVHGPARLPAGSGGGVLGELLGDAPRWSSGGLNTRV